MSCRAIVIGGTHTGVGKTSIAIGLMSALAERGLTVQPYKIGPDFVDPTHHRAATGRCSHNLDSWMLDRPTNAGIFSRHCRDADAAIVEGVMGLYDGSTGSSASGSTAQMARWLDLPVVLVVDAWPLARSVAALVKGYVEFDPALEVAGVILNRVASDGHEELLREALYDVDGVDVLGGIPRRDELEIPERHLGLHMAGERTIPQKYVSKLGRVVEDNVDLDHLLRFVARPAKETPEEATPEAVGDVRIAVARDDVFCFYYEDNFERLEALGAELVPFSPLASSLPDSIDGIYIGGGYPENEPAAISANRSFLDGVVEFASRGGPILAECGGLMTLGNWLETLDGDRYRMAGLFPWGTRVTERPKLDYVQVTARGDSRLYPRGETARGHLFHHSEIVGDQKSSEFGRCYDVAPVREANYREGYCQRSVLASYVHVHFGSNPAYARGFVERCMEFKRERQS